MLTVETKLSRPKCDGPHYKWYSKDIKREGKKDKEMVGPIGFAPNAEKTKVLEKESELAGRKNRGAEQNDAWHMRWRECEDSFRVC